MFGKRFAPPSLQKIEDVRRYREEEDRQTKECEDLCQNPAHVALRMSLLEANFPGNIQEVMGKFCSYWYHGTLNKVRPCVSQILGVRMGLFYELELVLSSGPSDAFQVLTYRKNGWGFLEREGFKTVENLQLL